MCSEEKRKNETDSWSKHAAVDPLARLYFVVVSRSSFPSAFARLVKTGISGAESVSLGKASLCCLCTLLFYPAFVSSFSFSSCAQLYLSTLKSQCRVRSIAAADFGNPLQNKRRRQRCRARCAVSAFGRNEVARKSRFRSGLAVPRISYSDRGWCALWFTV